MLLHEHRIYQFRFQSMKKGTNGYGQFIHSKKLKRRFKKVGERSLEQFGERSNWSGHLIAHWSEKGGGSSLERFSIAHWSCFEAKKLIGAVLQGAHWGGNQRGSNFFKRKTTGRMEKELR